MYHLYIEGKPLSKHRKIEAAIEKARLINHRESRDCTVRGPTRRLLKIRHDFHVLDNGGKEVWRSNGAKDLDKYKDYKPA